MCSARNRSWKTDPRSSGATLIITLFYLIKQFKAQRAAHRFVALCFGLLLAGFSLRLIPGHSSATALSEPRQLITEFMACNEQTLRDQDGEYSDWIEIHNREDTPVDLGGWHLTDDENDMHKWRFPPTILPPKGYLIVFASGKDRATTGSELHTNFCLDNGGEYLALVQPDGLTVEHASTSNPRVWTGVKDVGTCAADTQCRSMLLFCSPEHLDAWKRSQPQSTRGFDLSLAQGVQLGAAIFRPFLQTPINGATS